MATVRCDQSLAKSSRLCGCSAMSWGQYSQTRLLGFGLMLPWVGDRRPHRSRAKVVLPQPLSPSRAVQPRSRVADRCSKMADGLLG